MKKINSALLSVFLKDGLEPLARALHAQGIRIISTGGTMEFIKKLGLPCTAVEEITKFPEILGGRVKTLHPLVFGAILGKRNDEQHAREMLENNIPQIDLVVVDLYPFSETVEHVAKEGGDEQLIIEKIDIGGPSMIRAAAKNFKDVVVVADKNDYEALTNMITEQDGKTSIIQRREFARKAFDACTAYDMAISNYFGGSSFVSPFGMLKTPLRYGENPHQPAEFIGNYGNVFSQLHGKELSYNNLVDIDAALSLMKEFEGETTFSIIKHTNVCGIAQADTVTEAWKRALAGDPESAFGGVLACNAEIDMNTASLINELFFEVILAPSYAADALEKLRSKKNRVILQIKETAFPPNRYRSVLNGLLLQEEDRGNFAGWKEEGGRVSDQDERSDLEFANLVCKHLKSNAIALVKNRQLLGKGCGQTSRVDALRHAIAKANQFEFNLQGAVLASDAFFPFDDCVKIAHAEGIEAFIQPGGSVRDADSVNYCRENNLVMVLTGMRHFRH